MRIFKRKKGFTLIELLVVVAIIGLLATIVIVNVNSARGKAKDKGIITSMNSLRAGGDLWYTANNGTYVGFCGAGCSLGSADWRRVCTSVQLQGGVLSCNNSATAWAASSSFPSGGTYCVDSVKRTGSAAPDAGYTCP